MAYSDNLLLNPSAEFGLVSWQYSGVSTAIGASKGHQSFDLSKDSYLTQTVAFDKSPPDIQFDFDYWIKTPMDNTNIFTRAKIELTIRYNDNSSDYFVYPCRGINGKWHAVRETIEFDIRPDAKQLVSATVKASCVGFTPGLLIDGFAIRKQESDTSVDTEKYDDFWDTAITYGLDKDKPLLRG